MSRPLGIALIASLTVAAACGKDAEEPSVPEQDMAKAMDMAQLQQMDLGRDLAMPDLAEEPPDQFMPPDMAVACLGNAGELVYSDPREGEASDFPKPTPDITTQWDG